jgi:pheromone shutdown protein TraB
LKSFRRKRLYPNCNGAPVKYSLIAGRNKFLISNLLPIMNPNTIIKIITVVGAILTGVGEILKELNEQHKLGTTTTEGTNA